MQELKLKKSSKENANVNLWTLLKLKSFVLQMISLRK